MRMSKVSLSDEIRELSQPSLFSWLWRMAFDWSLVAAVLSFAHYFNQVWSYAIAVVVLGPIQHAIGVLAHDGAHRRIHSNTKFNDFLSIAFGLAPLMQPYHNYRRFHSGHHLYTGTEKDGEMAFKRMMAPSWDVPLERLHILKTAIRDCLGLNIKMVIRMTGGMREASKADVAPIVIFWTLVTTAMFFSGTLWILPMWFIASSTSFWASFRLRLWAEHIGTAGTHRFSFNLFQRLVFLPHNIGYHYEHHLYPSVPLWNLPKLRALLTDEPIMTLAEQFRSYERLPVIRSGEILANPNGMVKGLHKEGFSDAV